MSNELPQHLYGCLSECVDVFLETRPIVFLRFSKGSGPSKNRINTETPSFDRRPVRLTSRYHQDIMSQKKLTERLQLMYFVTNTWYYKKNYLFLKFQNLKAFNSVQSTTLRYHNASAE
jgi:hypothetical protein